MAWRKRKSWHPSTGTANERRRWQAVRRSVFDRDGWRCRVCGKAGRLECDHILPLFSHGHIDPFLASNLQSICVGCHWKKTGVERSKPLTKEQAEWKSYLLHP